VASRQQAGRKKREMEDSGGVGRSVGRTAKALVYDA